MGMEVALLLSAAGVGALICLKATPIGRRLGVLDHPDNVRKQHKRATPQVGGISVILGLMLWISASTLFTGLQLHGLLVPILLCGTGVAIVGFTDDQNGMSPLARLAFLTVFVLIAFVLDSELIASKLNTVLFSAVPIPIWGYIVLMLVASLGIVNAVNMADGQDGVAAGMFVIWSACLVYLTTGPIRAIAAVLHVLCLVFLVFNLRPRNKVFLGDCGSYGITFIIGMIAVLLHAKGVAAIETILVWFFIPMVDCLRLLVVRAKNGNSPFLADRDHFHHRLEQRFGKRLALVSYLGAVAGTSAMSTILPHWAPICLCILTGFYFFMTFAREKADVRLEPQQVESLKPSNVVSISGNRRGAA